MGAMSLGVKVIFTVACLAVAVAVVFVDACAKNAGPDWFWRGGRRDGFRRAICRPDGRLRRYTKLALWIGLVAFALAVWRVA
jgi:hypothetical protein